MGAWGSRGWTSRAVGQEMLSVALSPRLGTEHLYEGRGSLVLLIISMQVFPAVESLCNPQDQKYPLFPDHCFLLQGPF